LKNVYTLDYLGHDEKLYKYFPFNSKNLSLSYIDKYGNTFGRVDDLFEFKVNKFIFNSKFNKFVVENLNMLRFLTSFENNDIAFLSLKTSFMKQLKVLSRDVLWFKQIKPIYGAPRFDVV